MTYSDSSANCSWVGAPISVPGSVQFHERDEPAVCVWASAIVVVTGCGGDVAATDVSTATVAARSLTVQPAIAVGAAPAAVFVGARFVWVADNVGSTVDRIDRATRRVTGSTPVAAGPRALAVADGIVWVASASGSVTRLDTGTGAVRGRPIPVADAAGVALGEGSAWVTSRSTDTVVRIDAATGRREGAAIRVGSAPTDIAVAQGQVWIANSEDGTVTPIDMGTARAGSPIRVAEQQLLALAAGPSGVWVAKSDRPEADPIEVASIDPRSGRLDGPGRPRARREPNAPRRRRQDRLGLGCWTASRARRRPRPGPDTRRSSRARPRRRANPS